METDNALIGFADTHQQNAGGAKPAARAVAALDLQLVTGDDRYAAPGNHRGAEDVECWRRGPAPGAFTTKGSNCLGVGQKEGRFLPDQCQQLVEIVWRRPAVASADTERRGRRVQQPKFFFVDQFPFLSPLVSLNGQPHLFFQLIVWSVEKIRYAGVYPYHGLHGRKGVFAGS